MSLLTWINDFPQNSRGTYRLKADEEGTEADKLTMAKSIIKNVALRDGVDILLDAKMQGNRWVLVWWPASEIRHQETDQIIFGAKRGA